jgi:hypothetical protein
MAIKQLTDGMDSISFRCGGQIVHLSGDTANSYRIANDTVNGFMAIVTMSIDFDEGYLSMIVPKAINGDRFIIWGERIQRRLLILNIFKDHSV